MSGLGAWQIESTGIGLELNTWLLMWEPNLCKHEGNREMLKQRGNTVYQNISNTWLLRKLCITVVSFFFSLEWKPRSTQCLVIHFSKIPVLYGSCLKSFEKKHTSAVRRIDFSRCRWQGTKHGFASLWRPGTCSSWDCNRVFLTQMKVSYRAFVCETL